MAVWYHRWRQRTITEASSSMSAAAVLSWADGYQAPTGRYNVEQALTGKITVRHPDVGIIHIDVIETKFPAHPGLTMSVHVPARPADRDKIAHLA